MVVWGGFWVAFGLGDFRQGLDFRLKKDFGFRLKDFGL